MTKFPVVSRDTLFIVPSLPVSLQLELQRVEGVSSLPLLVGLGPPNAVMLEMLEYNHFQVSCTLFSTQPLKCSCNRLRKSPFYVLAVDMLFSISIIIEIIVV